MAKRGFLAKHGIVRSAIRKDLLFFGLPALVVLLLGLIVSAQNGYDGMVETLFKVLLHPQDASQLSAAKVVGLVLMVTGFTIAFVAVYKLKRFYSSTLVTREDHRLVTHGIYRFVRHPIYLGVLVILVVAVPVYSSSLWGFLTMSLLIPIFLNRIRMEERLLVDHFGDAYRAYQASSRKVIPFLY